jgi:hypothetical protein
VGGSNGNSNGLVDGLLSMLLWNQSGKDWHHEVKPTDGPTAGENGQPLPKAEADIIAQQLSDGPFPKA